MIYFDNAATSYPKPPEVFEFMLEFMRESGGNPGRAGHRLAIQAEEMVNTCRAEVSAFFGLRDPRRCVFTMNCSDALNLAIKGVLRGGEHVVTTALEHNAINRPLQQMAERKFITFTRANSAEAGCWQVDEILRAITPQTRLVAVTHCANASGIVNPVAELGHALRALPQRIIYLVDAAQTAGVIDLDMEAAQIDLLAFPGHKGLFAPTGTGALLIGSRVSPDEIAPWREGGTGGDAALPHQPNEFPYKLEGGTPNTMGIAGMLAGVRFLRKQPSGAVLRHERGILARLIGGFRSDARITLHGTPDPARRAGAIGITVKDRDNGQLAAILDREFGIAARPGLHCAPHAHRQMGTFPGGTLRFSTGYFNTPEEADAVVRAVLELAARGS